MSTLAKSFGTNFKFFACFCKSVSQYSYVICTMKKLIAAANVYISFPCRLWNDPLLKKLLWVKNPLLLFFAKMLLKCSVAKVQLQLIWCFSCLSDQVYIFLSCYCFFTKLPLCVAFAASQQGSTVKGNTYRKFLKRQKLVRSPSKQFGTDKFVFLQINYKSIQMQLPLPWGSHALSVLHDYSVVT